MTSLSVSVETIFEPARLAVAEGRIPGVTLGLVNAKGERSVLTAGLAQREPESIPLHRTHWFDLASLTKVIFTTDALIRLVEQGRVALDDPLSLHIPDLRQYETGAAERRLTIRQCLSHQTHLPAVEPLYTLGQDPETLRAYILQRNWKSGPPVYSDINFILLGILIERVTGTPLSAFDLSPGLTFRPDPASSVATEFCAWRGRMIRGEVHDENAFALGGVAGHAGLFGTVDGVLDYAASLMGRQRFSAPSMADLTTLSAGTRTLGWEIAHPGWHGGEGSSARTIGHLGFTGTGLWIDMDRGVAWTLLTNRVHPSRHSESGIMALRRETGTRLAAAFKQD